ncbi:hypothetical protein CK203_099505 [Vitis vinifera]|uniref:Uncharacterized protein n=1 Tax=Vitis vinifera TaxID=29760 RepID=A0A438DVA7_VITVI|nr:hypothetical protein CK203_099505 [Vitis vinifera]
MHNWWANLSVLVNCFQDSWQVNYGIGALYYICNESNKEEIVRPEVVDVIKKYASKVNYGIGALYYICNESNKEEIVRPEVVDVIKKYAAAGSVSVNFSNLAKAFLDKHVSQV